MNKRYALELTENELRYLVAVSFAVAQHVPTKSLPTYTGFTEVEIREFITKVRNFMDQHEIDM